MAKVNVINQGCNDPKCGATLDEHIGGKFCNAPRPARKARGLYDLPIAEWAWKGDAKQFGG